MSAHMHEELARLLEQARLEAREVPPLTRAHPTLSLPDGYAIQAEGLRMTLLLLSPMRNIARQLHVPNTLYGEARKVLRERIRLHGFQVQNTGLDLGLHDDRDTA